MKKRVARLIKRHAALATGRSGKLAGALRLRYLNLPHKQRAAFKQALEIAEGNGQ